MNKILDLGEMFVSEFSSKHSSVHSGLRFPLALKWDERLGCAVLTEQPPAEMMWGLYWYKSGLNPQMVKDLHDVVQSIDNLLGVPTQRAGIWLDIACNDGTLLNKVNVNYMKIGIDPCKNEIADECQKQCNILVRDFFSAKAVEELQLWEKPKVITCCAMFYDLKDPIAFLYDVYNSLHDDGVFVMQFTYTVDMLEMNDFMNICHEHYAYHYFSNVYRMMVNIGFNVFDVSRNNVNGGSIRIFAEKQNDRPISDEVKKILNKEHKIDFLQEWKNFDDRIKLYRFKFIEFLRQINKQGAVVWGLGASTKGNTLLQYYGLSQDEIVAIADVNPSKFGRYTKGTGIPITSEDSWKAIEAKNSYTIIFPFHFLDFFLEKHESYLDNGGVFIVPCPKPHTIKKVDGKIVINHI